ncbi:hypothetical protein OIU77_014541 [Salix suchowensis]|uniref:YqaJ viral recombinase domain-containing protein n=1 Tax=Salix suchowensis TaxID=1278906 RepID=A0ABQ8ZY71_9ROSI|nr:hypothetical protein OIU77_014541 [Salix suchowensis]
MKLIQLSSIQSRVCTLSVDARPFLHSFRFSPSKDKRYHLKLSFRVWFSIFYTSSEPAVSQTAPPIVHSPSSLVLAACVTGSDAPQRSEEWFALRRDRLTTSTFSTALGFWKGKRRPELWHEKVFESETQTPEASANSAMQWGVLNEAAAINRYKNITGREVNSLGFAIHSEEQLDWLGASPDGLLGASPDGLLGASPDGLSGCFTWRWRPGS